MGVVFSFRRNVTLSCGALPKPLRAATSGIARSVQISRPLGPFEAHPA